MRRVSNPPNPWQSHSHELLGPPPTASLEVYEDDSRSILSRNDSPDLPFRWSINPYRGCFHACSYCFARPSHEYLGFGAGSDFDFKITIKPKAADLLRQSFEKSTWRGELVNFSGVTDCYQPLEAIYQLTRQCLEVCLEYRNPVSIITKGALIERDIDLLVELKNQAAVDILISLAFDDADTARLLEPATPSPKRRLQSLKKLADAGLDVGIMLAPVILGLNDHDVPSLLRKAREAGAKFASYSPLRLPGSTAAVFEARLREQLPNKADKVLGRLTEARKGRVTTMKTEQSKLWQAAKQLFELGLRKHKFETPPEPPKTSPFRRPGQQPPQEQLSLFDV